MRETNFIEQNKEKWSKFEQILKESKKDPEELSNLFMEITDDLSYSRSFYPNRSVRVYLNNLAQRVFYDIYRNRKSRLKRFWQFWRDDVPQILFESRFDLLLSFIIFMLAISIGVFSSVMNPDFPRVILGDSYVEMTINNIENGNPMSVYQDPNQASMFLQITFNNLRVAFVTFILGLVFGGGAIYILLYNGIMVGAFQYLFFQHGVYLDSILSIWLHGAIEISSIVIAGAAGIHLGKGLLFPGTYTRLQGLQLSARRALLIYLTIVPLIVMAGFIESFITRYSDTSYLVRALLILASFAFMIGYFVIYPWLKAKRGFTANLREVNLPSVKKVHIEFNSIKNSGQIFTDAFTFYRKQLKALAILSAIIALVYTAAIMLLGIDLNFSTNFGFLFFFEALSNTVTNVAQLLLLSNFNVQWIMNLSIVAIISYFTLFRIAYFANKQKHRAGYYIQTAVSTIVISGFINALLIFDNNEGLILIYIIFVFPLLILWLSTIFNEGGNLLGGFIKTFRYLAGNWSTMMGAYIVMTLMCYVFLFLITAPILGFFNEIFLTLLPFSQADAEQFNLAFYLFIQAFVITFLFPLVFSTLSIAQFSFKETRVASELFEQIERVGVKKQSYGMDKEENKNLLY
jgi:uncharacterized membrane protein SpoIIM required for sporulation